MTINLRWRVADHVLQEIHEVKQTIKSMCYLSTVAVFSMSKGSETTLFPTLTRGH